MRVLVLTGMKVLTLSGELPEGMTEFSDVLKLMNDSTDNIVAPIICERADEFPIRLEEAMLNIKAYLASRN
jgi:hypothetical protein